jgi:hypothetical protein
LPGQQRQARNDIVCGDYVIEFAHRRLGTAGNQASIDVSA